LADSLFKRKPSKLEDIRRLHGMSADSPPTSRGQSSDSPPTVRDTRPTNQPDQPTGGEEARARVNGFQKSEDPDQAALDRALLTLRLYPTKAKDGRHVKITLQAQNLLAMKIAKAPDHPWEKHAFLVSKLEDTPKDAHNWAMEMPDPINYESMAAVAKKRGVSVNAFDLALEKARAGA